MKVFLRDQKGQALIEYVLMIFVVISVVGILGYGFREILLSVWQLMSCDITAACPSCPVDPSIKNKIASVCK